MPLEEVNISLRVFLVMSLSISPLMAKCVTGKAEIWLRMESILNSVGSSSDSNEMVNWFNLKIFRILQRELLSLILSSRVEM